MQQFSVGDITRDVVLPDARPLRHVREAFDRSVAVVLGVNDYQRGIPRLRTAVPDAEALAAVLGTQHAYTALLRRDAEVTGPSVRTLLGPDLAAQLGGELTERDRLLVYFAGHGMSLPSERGPEGWLLLADAEAADPRSFFAMRELRALISALPCRHVMIILDCCFAGTFRWAGPRCERGAAARAYRESLDRFVRRRAWQVLVSAGHDQVALDAVASGRARAPDSASIGALASLRIETEVHSPFAAALLRGLAGAADYTGDGLIVATELELYVRDAVERSTRIQQTPQLHELDEHDRGEFVFQVPGTTLALDPVPVPVLSLAACPDQGPRPYSDAERDRVFGHGRVIADLVDRVKVRPLTVELGPSGAGKSADRAEDQRVATLLQPFRGARLIVEDKGEWEPAHDWLVRGWPVLAAWLVRFGAKAFALQFELGEAANRWHRHGRAAQLWTDDPRLPDALAAQCAPDAWLNARERAFLAASVRRRRLRTGAVLAALGVAALTVLVIWDLCDRPHVDYYRGYVLRWGEPEGIDPLSEREVRGRVHSYMLVRTGRLGHVQHVALVADGEALAQAATGGVMQPELAIGERLALRAASDGSDKPALGIGRKTEGERVACQWDFAYVADTDTVGYETVKDCQGKIIQRLQYRGGSRNHAKAAYVDLDDNDAPVARGNAELVEFVRSPQGFDVEKRYKLRYHGKPALNQDRIAIEKRDYDGRGHVIGVAFLDRAGRPTRSKDGIAGWRSAFDEHGDETWRMHLDEAGKPTRNKEGVASMRSTYDERGNQIEVASFDAMTRPTWSPEGVAVTRSRYDERGNLTEVAFFDENNRPTWNKDGIAGWRATFDVRGNRTRLAFFDENNRPARSKDGIAGWRATFDARGNQTETVYLDEAGKPTRNKDGIAGSQSKFDERGYEIELTYMDEAGQPTWGKDGYARVQYTADDRGIPTSAAYFDRAGKPTHDNHGAACIRIKYNDLGDPMESESVDEAGDLVWHDGYARSRIEYDDRGNAIELTWFDAAGHPARNREGVARSHTTYDERGSMLEMTNFDETGKPLRSNVGCATVRHAVDAWGDPIEISCFDEAGKPTRHKDGVAGTRHMYDEHGHLIEERYLDEAGTLRAVKGVAISRATFDAHGNKIEVALFDRAGKPTQNAAGVAGWRSAFDPRGHEIEVEWFDEAGKPTRGKDGIARARRTFDARGDQIEEAYFDEAGHPVRREGGYASRRSTFDERGREIQVAFFDEAGRPVRHKNGYASRTSTFDARNREIARAFFDAAGRPVRSRDGYASWTATFDERGNEVARRYFDAAHRPVPARTARR